MRTRIGITEIAQNEGATAMADLRVALHRIEPAVFRLASSREGHPIDRQPSHIACTWIETHTTASALPCNKLIGCEAFENGDEPQGLTECLW